MVDISAGGIRVDLDGGHFDRGDHVQVEFEDGLVVDCWVCHAIRTSVGTQLGMSLDPVEALAATEAFELVSR